MEKSFFFIFFFLAYLFFLFFLTINQHLKLQLYLHNTFLARSSQSGNPTGVHGQAHVGLSPCSLFVFVNLWPQTLSLLPQPLSSCHHHNPHHHHLLSTNPSLPVSLPHCQRRSESRLCVAGGPEAVVSGGQGRGAG